MGADADLVERLRSQANDLRQGALYSPSEDWSWDATTEAADAIEELTAERDASQLIINDLTAEVERLRAENERLRALADQLADALRTVLHDRPSAHTDNVWAVINHALITYEEACRER